MSSEHACIGYIMNEKLINLPVQLDAILIQKRTSVETTAQKSGHKILRLRIANSVVVRASSRKMKARGCFHTTIPC